MNPHFPHLTLETYRKVQVWEVWEVRVYFALSHYMGMKQKQKNDFLFCIVLTFLYLSSINLKTNCPAKLISVQSAVSKRDKNLTRQPLSFRVLNNTFLFELSAQTGFHCRPCHWLICKRGIIHHKDNSLAVGGILCHPLLSLTDVSQSFLTVKSL